MWTHHAIVVSWLWRETSSEQLRNFQFSYRLTSIETHGSCNHTAMNMIMWTINSEMENFHRFQVFHWIRLAVCYPTKWHQKSFKQKCNLFWTSVNECPSMIFVVEGILNDQTMNDGWAHRRRQWHWETSSAFFIDANTAQVHFHPNGRRMRSNDSNCIVSVFPSNHVNDLLLTAHNNYNQIHWQPIFVYAFVTNSLMANLLNGSKIKCATPTNRHRRPIANPFDVGLARTANMNDLRTLYTATCCLHPLGL